MMWVPPEDTDPVLLHAPTRKSVAVFGAVCETDGRFHWQRADKFCAVTFLEFLKGVLTRRRRGRKMVIVLDNARFHHATALSPWLEEHRKELCLDFLPPYSPDLNPTERVWKLTRRLRTHNQYFPELDQLVASVTDQFTQWQKPNETLHRLCAII